MSIGDSAGAGSGDVLRVDTEMLSQLGSQLEASASAIPDPPTPFSVTGGDAISQAIAAKLPSMETPIIEGLPAVKEAAGKTASNMVSAADRYQTTDEQLAAEYEKHRFDGSGSGAGGGSVAGAASGGGAAVSAGAGGAASAGSAAADSMSQMGQMGQMMSTPMQMASQAAQMPMQAMGAASSAPQAVMQGVQQISQLAGKGAGSGTAPPDGPRPEERPAEDRQDAGSEEGRERVPESAVGQAPQSDSAVPDQRDSGPRHAKPDPAIDV